MADKVSKKYTVGDVYLEAARLLKDELQNLKQRPLTETEEGKMKELAKVLSKTVLQEMRVI